MDKALNYNYKIVRQFTIATVIWGVIGMLAGVFIAAQLAWPALNFDTPWLSYGRLRPLRAPSYCDFSPRAAFTAVVSTRTARVSGFLASSLATSRVAEA